MKNIIITLLVTLTLLLSFVIPVIGSHNNESIGVLCTFSLKISIVGNGTVIKNPNESEYYTGTSVELNATPDPGWVFDHWAGDLSSNNNPVIVVMDSNKIITAYFTENITSKYYNLVISVNGSGTTSPAPATYSYLNGSAVNLSANANPGWAFDHWDGDLSGSKNPDSIVINSNKSVTAYFEKTKDTVPPNVNITKPKDKTLYKDNKETRPILLKTRIIGPITIEVNASDEGSGVDKVEFYINNVLKYTDTSAPYNWTWDKKYLFLHLLTVKVIAYDKAGNTNNDTITVWKMGDFNFIRNHPWITLILSGLLLLNKLKSGKETTGPSENKAPEADAGGPYTGVEGSPVQFDGSGSSNPDNGTLKYEWDFGDGSTGAGEKPLHTYNMDGEYTVTLTVTDSAGASNTDTATVKITKYPSTEGGTGSAEEGNLFWYIVGGLGLALLASLVVLLTRRKFYV